MANDYAGRPERLWIVGMPSGELERDQEAWSEAEHALGGLTDMFTAIGSNDAVFVALLDARVRCRKHRERLEARDREPAVRYPTVFAKVLSRLAGYLGEDWDRLASDLVSGMGDPHGDADRDTLAQRLESQAFPPPSVEFMHGLTVYLDLERDQQEELAMAAALEN